MLIYEIADPFLSIGFVRMRNAANILGELGLETALCLQTHHSGQMALSWILSRLQGAIVLT